MKKQLMIGVLLAAAGGVAQAQEPARAAMTVMVEGQSIAPMRTATAVETRITTGHPYSAEATTEFVQVLGDGNKIARKASVRVYRDGEGRTRREEIGSDGAAKSISIYDPVAHVTYLLDPATRTARKSAARVVYPPNLTDEQKRNMEEKIRAELMVTERAAGRLALVAPEGVPAQAASEEIRKRQVETIAIAGGSVGVMQPALRTDARSVKEESLGQKAFDGVLADGKRVTTVVPAGAVGNQQAITVQSEQWFAPDLEILLMTRHSDPRTGETTYTLSNITRGEPGAGLFDVPGDYTIQESGYSRLPASR